MTLKELYNEFFLSYKNFINFINIFKNYIVDHAYILCFLLLGIILTEQSDYYSQLKNEVANNICDGELPSSKVNIETANIVVEIEYVSNKTQNFSGTIKFDAELMIVYDYSYVKDLIFLNKKNFLDMFHHFRYSNDETILLNGRCNDIFGTLEYREAFLKISNKKYNISVFLLINTELYKSLRDHNLLSVKILQNPLTRIKFLEIYNSENDPLNPNMVVSYSTSWIGAVHASNIYEFYIKKKGIDDIVFQVWFSGYDESQVDKMKSQVFYLRLEKKNYYFRLDFENNNLKSKNKRGVESEGLKVVIDSKKRKLPKKSFMNILSSSGK